MKRTSSQALIASRKLYETLLAWVKKYPVLGVLGLLFGLILSFQLGRTTAAMPGEFSRAMAGMRLEILEQQREVDRLTQDNRSNINALAARLAELQAASTRLDALGERLTQMGQLTLDEFDFSQPAAVGGPADPATLVATTETELRDSTTALGEKLRRQAEQLDALQYLMLNRQMDDDLTPSGWPVNKGWISSRYGDRTDPFTGQRARHEGLDFVGPRGSDVLSVAAGVVVWADVRSGYGQVVEIDHGNGYVTRYAHCDSVEVEPGTQVSAGQLIAKLGKTGRASTPHVHFEVLQNGTPINPANFVGQLR
jgi:murein DD-endopeptidase MepM/ murein hydrolase activator NlpD